MHKRPQSTGARKSTGQRTAHTPEQRALNKATETREDKGRGTKGTKYSNGISLSNHLLRLLWSCARLPLMPLKLAPMNPGHSFPADASTSAEQENGV